MISFILQNSYDILRDSADNGNPRNCNIHLIRYELLSGTFLYE